MVGDLFLYHQRKLLAVKLAIFWFAKRGQAGEQIDSSARLGGVGLHDFRTLSGHGYEYRCENT